MPDPVLPASSPRHPTAEPDWAKPSIGILSLALFALGLGVTWFYDDKTAFNLLIGAVISNATTVVSYYFGSSSGSAQKMALLAAAAPPQGR